MPGDQGNKLLRVRGLSPTPEMRSRIEGCDDLRLLWRWLERAEEADLDALLLDT